MRPTEPPKSARWLLIHFGCSPNNGAVIGDLGEQYLQRGSRLWYWRQVLAAIFASTWNEVIRQKIMALLALAIGWASFFSVGRMLLPF